MGEPLPFPAVVIGPPVVRPVGYNIRLELDVDAGSDGRFAEVAMQWLDEGTRTLDADLRAELDRDPTPPWQEPDDPEGAYGPPGGAWGQLAVVREPMPGGRIRHAQRPASAKGWHWLTQQLRQPPFATAARLRRLDDQGQPIRAYELEAMGHSSAPGWMQLGQVLPSAALTSVAHGGERQRQSLDLLRLYADRLNPSYGQIGPSFDGNATNLETCLPVDYGRNRPWNTIVESRQFLRGYNWVTVLAAELATRLGGAEALAATGVFHEVTPLAGGGVLLRATEDYRDYDQADAERVFRVLAPVLRHGRPEPQVDSRTGRPQYSWPLLVVYEDAAGVDRGDLLPPEAP